MSGWAIVATATAGLIVVLVMILEVDRRRRL